MDIKVTFKLDLGRKTSQELLAYSPYPAEISEQVYGTLLGHLIPECCLPWVENIFVPGHACYEEYCRMRDAYGRLCERLGVEDEDEDVERIVDSLLEHGRILAMAMFEYGRKYQKMQDTKEGREPGQ